MDIGNSLYTNVEQLVGDAHDIFTFRAVPGLTYQFCTTPGASSTTCVDESSSDRVAEILILGPAPAGQSGVVTSGLTKGASGLSWTVPSTPANVETYAAVVRRRARYEGGDVADYQYRLKYTIPAPSPCSELSIAPFFCTPTAPAISGAPVATHDSITVFFTASVGATGYRVERVGGGETVEETAAADATSHTFSGLDPTTEYAIQVRGYNEAADSAWSAARTATTLALPFCSIGEGDGSGQAGAAGSDCRLRAPTGLRVSDLTPTSATLHWTAPHAGLSYELGALEGWDSDCAAELDEQTGWPTTTGIAHPFTTLSQATDYRFCARSVRTVGTGPSAVTRRSAWARADASTPPDLPENVRVTAKEETSLTLSWDPVERDGLSYEVRLDGGAAAPAQSAGSHQFSGLSAGREYRLGVQAKRGAKVSGWREVRDTTVSQVCPSPRPERPAPLTRTETLSTSYTWVERGTTAHQQKTETKRDDTKPYEWQDYPQCVWQLAADWVLGTPYTVGPTDTGETQEKPEDEETEPAGTRKVWEVGESKACEQLEQLERKRTRTVTFSMAEGYTAGEWSEWGDPYVVSSDPTGVCRTKPHDEERELKKKSGEPYWTVSGMTACEYQDYEVQPQRNPAVWSGTAWVFEDSGWTDDGAATIVAERTTTACKVKPADDVVHDPDYQTQSQTRWLPVDDGLFCLEHEQKRYRYKGAYFRRPHVWSDTQAAWVDGVPETAPFFVDPVFGDWTDWDDTGNVRPCALSSDGGGDGGAAAAGVKPARLSDGDYRLEWGEHWLSFTVPEGATLTLRGRVLDSGVHAAVFQASGGEELVVDPAQLSRTEPPAELTRNVSDPSLTALAGSLRLAPEAEPAEAASMGHECVVTEPADQAAALELDDSGCAVVRGGGALQVQLGEHRLSLSLPADRDWLVAASRASDSVKALVLVELASGSYVLLSAATGAELSRQVAADAPDVAAVLDGISAAPGSSRGG